jgi:hypothetical protein
LVPSADWPAYRYGKLAFSAAHDVPRGKLLQTNTPALATDSIFAGFNVEKGYGQAATFVNPALKRKPAQIADPGWLWFELTSKSGAAQFSRTLSTVAARDDLYVYVVVGYVHDRESGHAAQHDALMFKCDGDSLTKVADNGCPINQLQAATRASTFTALAEQLRPIDDYHWVDLYVGTHVPVGDVDMSDLHGRVTSCFDVWLR